MKPASFSLLTICGLEELGHHSERGVTHVLSILDPDWPEPEAFCCYDAHHRTTLRFHDVIEPRADTVLPRRDHVESILRFGRWLSADAPGREDAHLLVHCHMGVSRSTAAVAMLLAQERANDDEDRVFARLLEIRREAWPNSLMIAFADDLLERGGRLSAALARLYAGQLGRRPEIEQFMREHGRGREVDMALSAAKNERFETIG